MNRIFLKLNNNQNQHEKNLLHSSFTTFKHFCFRTVFRSVFQRILRGIEQQQLFRNLTFYDKIREFNASNTKVIYLSRPYDYNLNYFNKYINT